MLEVGEEIGRYRVLSELGRGSMGRVYLVEDPNIGRKVALKVCRPEDVEPEVEQALQQRFVIEAKAAGRLNHPGIVTVHDAGTDLDRGYSYIAMEWVKGLSLHQFLYQRGGRLPVAMAADLVSQVALALDYAHREGVIHRDIKPANILIAKDGRAKVMDFGIAKLGPLTVTLAGEILGTPAFMSPEQIRNQPLDGRSDLFSLGVVLYLCLTGENPFQADNIADIGYRIVNLEVPAVRTLDPTISQALTDFVNQALRKSPDDRFDSGAEFARALAAAGGRATAQGTGGEPPDPDEWDALENLEDLEDMPPIDSTALATNPPGLASRAPRPHGVLRLLLSRPVAGILALGVGLLLLLWTVSNGGSSTQSTTGSRTEEAQGPAHANADAGQARPAANDLPRVDSPRFPQGDAAAQTPRSPQGDLAGTATDVTNATVEVHYINRLRQCELSVSVDGVRVWSREMSAKNIVKRVATGQRLRVAIPVIAGKRSFTVRITAAPEVDVVQTVDVSLEAGDTRRLRVKLKRRSNEMQLIWEE